jgi:hypothetical protein
VGDARIVDENVEPAELLADPVRGGGDRGLIRDVELDRVRVAVDALCRRLTVREVARADQDGKAVLREILCDRKSDPLVGPRDQRNLSSWTFALAPAWTLEVAPPAVGCCWC